MVFLIGQSARCMCKCTLQHVGWCSTAQEMQCSFPNRLAVHIANAAARPWYQRMHGKQQRMHGRSGKASHTTHPTAAQPAARPPLLLCPTSARLVLHHTLGALLVQYPVAALAAADHVTRLERVLSTAVAADVGHLWGEVGGASKLRLPQPCLLQ